MTKIKKNRETYGLAYNKIDIIGINILFSKINKQFKRAIDELNNWILLSNAKKICN